MRHRIIRGTQSQSPRGKHGVCHMPGTPLEFANAPGLTEADLEKMNRAAQRMQAGWKRARFVCVNLIKAEAFQQELLCWGWSSNPFKQAPGFWESELAVSLALRCCVALFHVSLFLASSEVVVVACFVFCLLVGFMKNKQTRKVLCEIMTNQETLDLRGLITSPSESEGLLFLP